MKILVVYNVARNVLKGTAQDLVCEQEITIIVPLIVALLQKAGHEVESLETTSCFWEHLKTRKGLGTFNLVLNLAEGFGGGNKDETLVPAMLEALGIPFTGASAHNMYLTLDKEKTKLVVQGYGVPVLEHQIFRDGDEPLRFDFEFPLIAKPIREEASIGIHTDSVVTNEANLRKKVTQVLALYRQPVLVEPFVVGRELSVGIVGNGKDLHVFPSLEFLFPEAPIPYEAFRFYDYKWGGKKEQMVRADLSGATTQALNKYTRLAFVATECRDYARMDYRMTESGDIYLLEVNYNPGIGPNTHGLNNTLTMMASFEGLGYEELIEWIVRTAAQREGLA